MIYTVTLVGCGGAATGWLVDGLRRRAGRRDRAAGWSGVVAWIAGEVLLGLGVAAFATVGVGHADGVDIGAVWIPAVVVLTTLMVEGALRPSEAARLLGRGAGLLVGLMVGLTIAAYVVDRTLFDRAGIGPLVETAVFVAAPALITATFFRLATRPSATVADPELLG